MYSVHNAVQNSMNSISIALLKKDKGDELGNYNEMPYDYEEESQEPIPAIVDNYGVASKIADPTKLNIKLQVTLFSKHHKGLNSPEIHRSSTRGRAMSIGGNSTTSQKKSNHPIPGRRESGARIISPTRIMT